MAKLPPLCIGVLWPLEAYPGGCYEATGDFMDPSVYRNLWEQAYASASSGTQLYLHFALECHAVSIFACYFNHCTRKSGNPLGNGSLEREVEANRIYNKTQGLILRISAFGHLWSLEI